MLISKSLNSWTEQDEGGFKLQKCSIILLDGSPSGRVSELSKDYYFVRAEWVPEAPFKQGWQRERLLINKCSISEQEAAVYTFLSKKAVQLCCEGHRNEYGSYLQWRLVGLSVKAAASKHVVDGEIQVASQLLPDTHRKPQPYCWLIISWWRKKNANSGWEGVLKLSAQK